MRTLTRERITTDPHRTLTATPDADLPGAVLLDQTGVRPAPITALNAIEAPDTVHAVSSPYRGGVRLLVAANSDAELLGLPATFAIGGRPHVYAGPALIVAYEDASGDTVALTLDEIFHVLRHVYVLAGNGAPDAHVTWLVALEDDV